MFSWLPAKEISIEELEQMFIGHLNETYKGEYKVLLLQDIRNRQYSPDSDKSGSRDYVFLKLVVLCKYTLYKNC